MAWLYPTAADLKKADIAAAAALSTSMALSGNTCYQYNLYQLLTLLKHFMEHATPTSRSGKKRPNPSHETSSLDSNDVSKDAGSSGSDAEGEDDKGEE